MAKASSKHRINVLERRETAHIETVLETTNLAKTSPKRRMSKAGAENLIVSETNQVKSDGRGTGRRTVSASDRTNAAPIPNDLPQNHIEEGRASPKRRNQALRPRNDEQSEGVPETTTESAPLVGIRAASKRPRNDDTADLFFHKGETYASHDDGGLNAYTDGIFETEDESVSAGEEAPSKRRKSAPRPRNDDEYGTVLETTIVGAASPKHRTSVTRPRNDESPTQRSAVKRGRPKLEPLTPVYDSEQELFICDVLDAIPKDDIPTMEHPIFTLATQPDMREIHYEHNGTIVDIWPSRLGLATIHDKDILIYCISQLIAKKNKGEPLGRTLKLQPYQLLTWARRQTSGDGYQRLVAALDRLSGTRIKTNITTLDGVEFTNGVGLITEYSIQRTRASGKIIDVQVTLSPWLFKMVEGANVLTLHRDYFLLRRPVDRRIYELARKHCGNQDKWSVSLEILKKKTGAGGTLRHFREDIRRLVATNHLPDYTVEFEDDVITFFWRPALAKAALPKPKEPFIEADVFNEAKIVAPGYDVYQLHREWIEWWRDGGCEPLKDPARAFVGFCRRRAERHPIRN